MPTATTELREEWRDDLSAIAHLERRGYAMTRTGFWLAPAGKKPSEKDYRAMDYLIQEWDYGGLIGTWQ